MSKNTRKSPPTVTPALTSRVNQLSIRQICLAGFLNGDSRADITKRIQEFHPTSRAAAIPAKHIAWHYGDMKKAGLLNAVLPAAE